MKPTADDYFLVCRCPQCSGDEAFIISGRQHDELFSIPPGPARDQAIHQLVVRGEATGEIRRYQRPPEMHFRAFIGSLRALCCECGAVRWVSRKAPLRGRVAEKDSSGERMLAHLKCSNCSLITRHALIRDFDPHADAAETEDHDPGSIVRDITRRLGLDDG